MVALMKSDNQIAQPQKSNEWYTPARYIEAAREVMGGIDLDPASCELANQTVKAKRYYSKEDDGLSKVWHGRVWLNPPFGTTKTPFDGSAWQGTSTARLFIRKLLEGYEQGNVSQAILLAKADPKQNWFHLLWEHLICFAYDNVYFNRPDGPPQRNQFGVCFVYLGPHEHKFIDIFSEFGTIAKRVSPPKSAPSTLWEVQR